MSDYLVDVFILIAYASGVLFGWVMGRQQELRRRQRAAIKAAEETK